MDPIQTFGFSILPVTKIAPQATRRHEPSTRNAGNYHGLPKVAHVDQCVWCMGDGMPPLSKYFKYFKVLFIQFEMEGSPRLGNVPVFNTPDGPFHCFPSRSSNMSACQSEPEIWSHIPVFDYPMTPSVAHLKIHPLQCSRV